MKKKRPTYWITLSPYAPETYLVHSVKPKLGICRRVVYLAKGDIRRSLTPRGLTSLIGAEWEFPKYGELLEVEDGVPTWVYCN